MLIFTFFLSLLAAGAAGWACYNVMQQQKELNETRMKFNELLTQLQTVIDENNVKIEDELALLRRRQAAAARQVATAVAEQRTDVAPQPAEPTTLFLSKATDDGTFVYASPRFEQGNSLFVLTTAGSSGTFVVTDDTQAQRIALMMPTESLTAACEGDNIQVSDGMTRIVTDNAGTANLVNGKWRVANKAVIHYEA